MNPSLVLSAMQRGRVLSTVTVRQMNNRFLSTDVKQQAISTAESAAKAAESAAKNADSAVKNATASANAGVTTVKNAGSTFIQRFTAFLAGTAVGFGANFYLVHEELLESNERFEKTLQEIQRKIA